MKAQERIWRLPIKPNERAGVRKVIKWLELICSNYRDGSPGSIPWRQKIGMSYGDLLSVTEHHEQDIRSLKDMLKASRPNRKKP